MFRLVRVDKRIPDGSIWQSRRAYLIDPVEGWTRVFGPTGTRWSNPLGGWTTEHEGISLFHPDAPFTISCHGPDDAKRFYVDIAHRVRIQPYTIEFVDLFLDVMIDPRGVVSEKDEHQLVVLPPKVQRFTRQARDVVRALIDAHDRLFDPTSAYFAVGDDARALAPSREALELV